MEAGWTCNGSAPSVCQKWGNGIKEGTEAWDDGNLTNSDGWDTVIYQNIELIYNYKPFFTLK